MSAFGREAMERQRVQDNYNDLVSSRMRERAECTALAKDAATLRALEGALLELLYEGLRVYPDAFRASRLSRETAPEFAARWANDIYTA
jgi:hypothetical protein